MHDKLIKPEVFDEKTKVVLVHPGQKYNKTENIIKQGNKVCFTKTFGTVLAFYSWLKKRIKAKYPGSDHKSYRKFRDEFQKIASNILVKVEDGKVALKGSPNNQWLVDFFPDKKSFFISFPCLLGMNGAWQWYSRGVEFPGLSLKVHPFYLTYFPTRHEHLILFDNWLSAEHNNFKKAIDIGCGCGVLTFYMLKYDIPEIFATDINVNAVYSLKNDLKYHKLYDRVSVEHGSFFDDIDDKFDLVVFNPPWIPGSSHSDMDKAIYYNDNLFEAFFEQASNKMIQGGRIALIFSNYSLIEGLTDYHPIEKQITNDDEFKVLNVFKIEKNNKKRNTNKKEIVELWDIEFLG